MPQRERTKTREEIGGKLTPAETWIVNVSAGERREWG